ncbi:hypothetical protein [Fuscibacter oryzae]|uniref:Uncharacterized protein n=1 Tax=Fuscibacter oryzae TaxID=2803939 RepID=A0A8J7MN32_9RHOB|nr:hypothetical protein [Fuscibacter oryzae]MBL4926688.1 hypothetical protein [Fuscibacter oryzae]
MNKGLFGFGTICLIAVGGVDYANQSRHTGQGLGQMTPASYFATITGRMGVGARTAVETPEPAAMPVPTAAADTPQPSIAKKPDLPAVRSMTEGCQTKAGTKFCSSGN